MKKLIIASLLSLNVTAYADEGPYVNCHDNQGRLSLSEFKRTEGGLGSLKLFNGKTFATISLFCGIDSNLESPISIACVSTHGGDDDKVTRVRIHRKGIEEKNIAVVEYQSSREENLHISDVIPMICDPKPQNEETPIDYSSGFCVDLGKELKRENASLEIEGGSLKGHFGNLYPNPKDFFDAYNGVSFVGTFDWLGEMSLKKTKHNYDGTFIAKYANHLHGFDVPEKLVHCVAGSSTDSTHQ